MSSRRKPAVERGRWEPSERDMRIYRLTSIKRAGEACRRAGDVPDDVLQALRFAYRRLAQHNAVLDQLESSRRAARVPDEPPGCGEPGASE